LTVIDNGIGFDVDAAWRTGVGLGSMFERVQSLGGSVELTSRPGTRLVATLPLHVVQPDAPHAVGAV
jgi:signal transduction histidine kinase